jgi:hypothetical protein
MSFHVKVCLGVAVLVATALGAVFLLSGGGEEAAIEELLKGAGAAAEQGDTEAFLAIVSRDFKSRDYDYDGVVRRIRSHIRPDNLYGRVEVSPAVQVQGEEADATARVRVGFGKNSQETLFRVKLRKEAGSWKVVSAEEVR